MASQCAALAWAPGEFTSSTSRPVTSDDTVNPDEVSRVLLCTGKVFYDLSAGREQHGSERHTAIGRVEQVYPLPTPQLHAVVARRERVHLQDLAAERVGLLRDPLAGDVPRDLVGLGEGTVGDGALLAWLVAVPAAGGAPR